jgi:type I restriction enzyme M protein
MIYGGMLMRNKKSSNLSVLKRIMSKSRSFDWPLEMDYVIIYTFLYKFCSDQIKDHLLFELKNRELTIDEAYENESYQEMLSFDILKLYGFYIKKPEAFMDEVINASNSKKEFLADFLEIFPQNIIFNSEYCNKQYFDDLFDAVSDNVDITRYGIDMIENIEEVIYLISKLDVFEEQLDFSDVFSILSASRMMNVDSNPEYITQVLSTLILCEKKTIQSAYDPFMKNGDSLLKLNRNLEFGLRYFYGKDESLVNYLYTLTKLFINNFQLNNVFVKREDATESIDINGASFDAILSRIPISIKNYHSSNINQSLEIAKRNKSSEVKNILLKELGMDSNSFTRDVELNQALENLVEKIGFESDSGGGFVGEYESLKDSEFLFLINLVDSLNDDGMMAISISENFLFKNSLETLRKYLTFERNYIDAVIRLPNEIYRKRPEVVIVFRKDKTDGEVLFVDMSCDYETTKSGSVYPGLFRKNLIFDRRTLSRLENVFLNRLAIPKFSNLISIAEIADNGFNLSVSRYVDTFEGEFISLDELVIEKQDIDSNINALNLKIEKMMDELNIRF